MTALTLLQLFMNEVLQFAPELLGALRSLGQEGSIASVWRVVVLNIPARNSAHSLSQLLQPSSSLQRAESGHWSATDAVEGLWGLVRKLCPAGSGVGSRVL